MPGGGAIPGTPGSTAFSSHFRDLLSFYLRIPVQNHVANIGKQLGGAIGTARKPEQLGRIIQERGGDFAGAEFRMIYNILQERNVRLYSANAEFPQ